MLAALLLGAIALSCQAMPDAGRFTVIAGFELASGATLADVLHKVGPVAIQESGRSGGYRASICYASAAAVVTFLSDTMGGDEHRLLGYAVARPGSAAAASCGSALAPFVEQELHIGGLRLGMSRRQFGQIVGTPVEWTGDTGRRFFHDHESHRLVDLHHAPGGIASAPVVQEEDVTTSIFGEFSGDALVRFEVWKIRTY